MKKSEFLILVRDQLGIGGLKGICTAISMTWSFKAEFDGVAYQCLELLKSDRLRIEAVANFGADQQDMKEGFYWWGRYDPLRFEFLEWWINDLKSREE